MLYKKNSHGSTSSGIFVYSVDNLNERRVDAAGNDVNGGKIKLWIEGRNDQTYFNNVGTVLKYDFY